MPSAQCEIDPGDVGDGENDDIMVVEMKSKLREVLRLAPSLQAFCHLTLEETQKRLDFASNIRDCTVLGEISPLLALSEKLLTEVSVTVRKVLNNLVNLNNSHPELGAKIVEINGSESSPTQSLNAATLPEQTYDDQTIEESVKTVEDVFSEEEDVYSWSTASARDELKQPAATPRSYYPG